MPHVRIQALGKACTCISAEFLEVQARGSQPGCFRSSLLWTQTHLCAVDHVISSWGFLASAQQEAPCFGSEGFEKKDFSCSKEARVCFVDANITISMGGNSPI